MDVFTGVCRGGLLDWREFTSRFEKGFLVVNRPAGEVAIYDRNELGDWVARRSRATRWAFPELVEGPKNRYRAAEESNYDVIAYDPERMPAWRP